jgi:hypothetical protein
MGPHHRTRRTSPTQGTWSPYAHNQVASSHAADTPKPPLTYVPSQACHARACSVNWPINDDEVGSMMRRDACRAFADRFGLPMINVAMLVEHRERIEGVDVQM